MKSVLIILLNHISYYVVTIFTVTTNIQSLFIHCLSKIKYILTKYLVLLSITDSFDSMNKR